MQTTIHPTSEAAVQAKLKLERASARVLRLLSFVPDDKLTWTPSPSAHSALRLVAHCAVTNRFFRDVINGTMPTNMPSVPEFFQNLYAAEETITTRESVVALLIETTAELSNAMTAVTTEKVADPTNSPFGAMPLAFWIDESVAHLNCHGHQLEYLQTIWGDLDNHSG